MVDATVTKRIHIGGLTPSITTAHIKDRFSSFGNVREVEEMKPDGLGQPRPFTFFTIETTPVQLKKCLNIMSGSHWRGTQLRLAEAKPRWDVAIQLQAKADAEPETIRQTIEKKRKRVMHARGEGVGMMAQDMRLVSNTKIAEKKKFWVIIGDGAGEEKRLIRPISVRPSHPIGVGLVDRREKMKGRRMRLPPSRGFRKVINPVQWGSTYVSASQLNAGKPTDEEKSAQEGSWEYESIDDDEVEEEEEDGKIPLGVWRRVVNGEVVEEEVVQGKRRRVDDVDEEDLDDTELPEMGDTASSPLFGSRALPRGEERDASPLFPTRADGAPSPSSPAVADEERPSSPLFPSRAEADELSSDQSASAEQSENEEQVDEAEVSSSPLFATRAVAAESALSPSPSPSAEIEQAATPPLFPTRALTVSPPAIRRSPTPPPVVKRRPEIPNPLREQARSERSQALGVLGALLGGVSPPRQKAGQSEWAGFAESDEDDEEVEVARGRSKSVSQVPAVIVSAGTHDDEVKEMDAEEPEAGPSDAAGSEASSSGSGSGSSGSEESSESDEMDVDPPAGDAGESSSGSGSGSSGSSDDDDDDDENSDDSSSDDSESDEEDSEEEEEDSDDEEMSETTKTEKPKTSALKDMFAPIPTTTGGFSLMANLDPDLEFDEDLDITIPLPVPASSTTAGGSFAPVAQVKKVEEALAPLTTSSRGKVKFDADPEIPLFFAIPTSADAIAGPSRRGEAPNPYNDLYIPTPPAGAATTAGGGGGNRWGGAATMSREYHGGGYQQQGEEEEGGEGEEEEEVQKEPLQGFWRQDNEGDKEMKAIWEKDKLELTQGFKKRFRDAKKQRRRRGGEDVE
ncbi:hypothetical protein CI109_100795 [Kwoniella shandongensis]|uniref:Uncharacterized protein n=1 Tax=Kwoniella shandongensis TaxID=1734106 RepID=A0A5M6BUU1_9TREE|nr:uncharacterized protein CI109_005026 [Kwoniella shandongensis]KAA5526636.1 hypothetical protein CI109_005026 [Kwoniella shandongensis]